MDIATSKDGTRIGYTKQGEGPALILVDGAMCFRAFGPMAALAKALAPRFTVYTYDRRGRGESGDTQPYALSREIEDVEAVLARAGGSACLYGISSGAALALQATARSAGIERLALYDPPFLAAASGPRPDAEYGSQLQELLAAARRGDAVELFLTTVGTPSAAIAGMRKAPFWPMLESIAPTLAYDSALLADGAVPRELARGVKVPVLVIAGGAGSEGLRQSAKATAEAIPHALLRILDGQSHDVSPDALAPVLMEFFLSGRGRQSPQTQTHTAEVVP